MIQYVYYQFFFQGIFAVNLHFDFHLNRAIYFLRIFVISHVI